MALYMDWLRPLGKADGAVEFSVEKCSRRTVSRGVIYSRVERFERSKCTETRFFLYQPEIDLVLKLLLKIALVIITN